MKLAVSLMGGFSVRAAGKPLIFPTKKSRGLLAYLALGQGQVYAREHLASLLWGDSSDEQARHSLRQALSDLRKALPRGRPDILRSNTDGLALNPTAVDLDVAAFERLVAEGTPQALARTAELYRGILLRGLSLEGEPWEEWLCAERERLQELAVGALKKLLAHHTETGAGEAAVQIARRLLVLDPHDEAVHRSLMRLYLAQGRRWAALQQYQVCLEALHRELGVEPEAETRLLYQELLPQRSQRPQTPEGPAPRAGRRPRPAPQRFRASSPATPLVGRASELDRLIRAMKDAWAGRGPLVAILGEAGIGKTRLLDELTETALRSGAQVTLGRWYETEQIFPLGPWITLLRTVIKGHELDGFNPVWQAELSQLLPELGEPGIHANALARDHRRLFDAVVGCVRHIAREQPQVLLLDDLHWADEMSLRLLSYLGRRSEGAPVLIVGTSRDDELENAPLLRRTFDEFDRDDRLVRLTLAPLDQAQTLELVRAIAGSRGGGSLPAGLGEQVWAASAGHPFMIVETLRALREEREALAAGHLPMPQRVRQLVLSRLARLSDRAQQLAAVAAVIGREFEFALLHCASGVSEVECAAAVEELVRRHVLEGAGELFDFVHDHVRKITYGKLIAPQRKLLHGRVARALEEIHGSDLEPYVEALGIHYREAEVWDKAHVYLRKAGREAFERVANREAIALFEQALAAVRRVPRSEQTLGATIDILIDLWPPLITLAEHRRALDFVREADVLARELGDRRRMGYAACSLGDCLLLLGAIEEAVEAGERALAIASSLGDIDLEVLATRLLGASYTDWGEYRRARDCFVRAIAALSAEGLAARPFRYRLLLQSMRYMLSNRLTAVGEFSDAIATGQASLQEIEGVEQPDGYGVTFACLAAGVPRLYKGDLLDAIPLLERALLAARGNFKALIPVSASFLGLGYVRSGRIPEGLLLLQEAVAELESTGQISFYVWSLLLLGEGYLSAGRLDDALLAAGRLFDAERTWKTRAVEADALCLFGKIASRRDPLDADTAECHFRNALDLADQRGLRPLAAFCHFERGRLYAKIGRTHEARHEILTAIDLFQAMQMTSWLSPAESALAEMDEIRI